jgi:predicted nucleic acid-binding protein
MKIDDAFRAVTRVFLDTAPVIYYAERHPQYGLLTDPIFDRLDAGTLFGVTSPVTLLECLVMPCRLGQPQLQQDFTDLIVRGQGVTFVPLTEAIASRGAQLRAQYGLTLPDAFQVAAALAAGCDAFLTNDIDLKRVRELPILVLGELQL